MSFPGNSPHVDKTNALIDTLSAASTDAEIEEVLLQAFGVFALGEIEELGILEAEAQVLVDAFAPFA